MFAAYGETMDHATDLLLSLFVAFVAAQIGGEVAQRLKLPSVVGQIAAGVAVGGAALGWVKESEPLELLSELGAVLLLFSVGLETRLHELRKVGTTALSVGALGVAVPFVLGVGWAVVSGFDTPKAAFVAAAFVATSAGITAKVLQELGALGRKESRIIMGAAVIDDILAMLLLAVVTGLQVGGGIDFLQLAKVIGLAVGFVFVVAVLGAKVMRRTGDLLEKPMDAESPLVIALTICLGLAVASAYIGLAAIIGAFLAGTILAETKHRKDLERDVRPILAFLVPFFFVVTGTKVDVRLLMDPAVLGSVAIVTVLAIIGKLVGCGFGARSLGRHGAAIVGVGMVPRGEVGIIVASLGRQAGVFPASTYTVIIAMSLLTSVFAPPVLGALLRNSPPTPEPDDLPYEAVPGEAVEGGR